MTIIENSQVAIGIIGGIGCGAGLTLLLAWGWRRRKSRASNARLGLEHQRVSLLDDLTHAEETLGVPLQIVVGSTQQAVTLHREHNRIAIKPTDSIQAASLAMLAIEGGVFPRLDVGEDVRNQWDDPLRDLDQTAQIACAIPIPHYSQSPNQWAFIIAGTKDTPSSPTLAEALAIILDSWALSSIREQISVHATSGLLHMYRTARFEHAGTHTASQSPASLGRYAVSTPDVKDDESTPGERSTQARSQTLVSDILGAEGVSAPRTMTRSDFERQRADNSHKPARLPAPRTVTTASNGIENGTFIAMQAWDSYLSRQWRNDYPVDDPRAYDASDRTRVDTLLSAKAVSLIYGAPGTGKEFLARAVHDESTRSLERVVSVDCAPMVESSVEMELFGLDNAPGILDAIANGTLILKSPGRLSQELMVAILDRCAAQHTHLTAIIRQKSAHAASASTGSVQLLRHRAGDHAVHIPALKEREGRIVPLATLLLEYTSSIYDHGDRRTLGADAERVLLAYDYPANIRDLKALIRSACLRTDRDVIYGSDFEYRRSQDSDHASEESERLRLIDILQRVDGDKSEGARLLGVTREGFLRKLKRHGLL